MHRNPATPITRNVNLYQVAVGRSITPLPPAGLGAGKAVPSSWSLDDHPVIAVGQPVESAVAQYGILEQPQPFVHGPVAGDHEAGDQVLVEGQLVQLADCWTVKRCRPRSSKTSRPGERKERKLRSRELSILAWAKVLK